ncbi:MAG TPA: PilZ domain-containing protein [Nitrospira sp.]|nr:PilZ domain-containing protein [Nitrospira sp.]
MPQSEPITILVINEHAEEIKVVTISLRGFFPDVRIDAAYSTEEAFRLASATMSGWAVVLIDEGSLPRGPSTLVHDLKRQIPHASVILQSTRTDAAAALEALENGADFFLNKQSPAFLTELLFCAKEAFDKRDLRLSTDRVQVRYSWLVDSLTDIVYELDADGRFLTLGRGLSALLGYHPEELVGRPYHTLFPQDQQPLARFRFNERRTGIRASTGVELTLLGKPTAAGVSQVTAAINARGVYDLSRRFVGTIGLIRQVPQQKKEQPLLREVGPQQRPDDLRALVRQMTELAQRLQPPLSTLLQEAQELSERLRESGVIERLGALIEHAAASARLGEQLSRAAEEVPCADTINRLLEDLFTSAFPDSAARGLVSDLTSALPPYEGDREKTTRLLRRLLVYAGGFLATVGRSHGLTVKTSVDTPPEFADAPTLFPLTHSRRVQVDIAETEQTIVAAALPTHDSPLDAADLFQLAGELGATLDISAPPQGPFRITVRFPATSVPSRPQPSAPPELDVPVAAQTLAVTPSPPPRDIRQVTPARTDRRTYARVPTALQAKVHSGSSEWDGTVVNLSVGGACIHMPADFPSLALQDAHITVTTSVATLELSGFIYERTLPDAIAQPSLIPASHLIVVLNRTPQIEAAVLTSMITATHERSLLFTLDIRLAAAPTGTLEAGRGFAFNLTDDDRREAVRIPLGLPARLETSRRPEPADRIPAQVTNLSRSGAALLIQARPEDLQGGLRIHFAPAHRGEAGPHELGAPDTILRAHVVWSAPDRTASTALHVPGTDFAMRAGLRFEPLTPYAERELNRVIRQYMRAQRGGETSPPAPIVSVPRECRNARGQAISIMDDHHLQLTDASRPVIIIAPGYGQIALDYVALAYYLAECQFRVLRYDPTNHLGNSDGELQHTTLRSLQHDLDKVIEFVRDTWPQAPVLVIASDLGARAALKSAAHMRPLDLLLLVNPAVDVKHLLMTAHGHDLIADYQFGLRRGVCNVLGFNVNVDQFVGDLIAGRCTDLDSTLEDLRLIRSPLCIATSPTVCAALPPADLPHAFMTALGAHTKLVNLSTPLTERRLDVHGAPPAAFKQLLMQLGSVIPVQGLSAQQEISAHPFVARQRRIEQEYTFLRHEGSQINREALCAAHLIQLPQLGNLHEYRKLLDDLYGLMSPLDSGSVLADAGVGQGDLTRAALVNHTYRAGQASPIVRRPPLMIGVGRARERLVQARHAVLLLQRELASGFAGRVSAMPPLAIGWNQADWMNALPFKSGSMTRLVCNLSLPYVPSPASALQEWHRTLHPEGSLIVTTFHPDTDLSPLYRRHLRQANQDEFSAQAQPLLHYFARLREAIRRGLLHTFDEAGLASLLRHCGIASFRILPIFDGQALVAVVGKQNSSSSIR